MMISQEREESASKRGSREAPPKLSAVDVDEPGCPGLCGWQLRIMTKFPRRAPQLTPVNRSTQKEYGRWEQVSQGEQQRRTAESLTRPNHRGGYIYIYICVCQGRQRQTATAAMSY
ncbi:hypothetical protein GGTG_00060 [Gaeumannomyces tritici R3-111a-1]|uniref:Uncharacterized protein n=1 Tax=Gaeumannomyces tritici (strain R3-111a-1) TaxID=644352 RepID=J3NFL4_GAET3|nr:hypothetical protein GGTG_00060 [Gaeumannomyces tritici R3-111a-1]EJT80054.1 hypothetical protein GGTG_00060 [Gaeumannomyces tritici R3-111a-1]